MMFSRSEELLMKYRNEERGCCPMKFIPHAYQQYAIDFLMDHPVAALLLDMGLG